MIESCIQHGLPSPTFEEISGGICVIFPLTKSLGHQKPDQSTHNESTQRREEILSLLTSPLSAIKVHLKLSTPPSLRTVKADLSFLRSKGLIEQIGRGKNTVWQKRG